MTSEQFCYWLQGFMEVTGAQSINQEETLIIRDHLKLVFEKETPERQGRAAAIARQLGFGQGTGTTVYCSTGGSLPDEGVTISC